MVPNIWKHAAALTAGILLLLGLPLSRAENIFNSGDTDAVSSASVILDQPSGRYLELIGKKLHPTEKNLKEWENFFSGGDFTYLFDDIVCSVTSSDPAAVEMAKSFQSRLPENQMRIQVEDATLLASRIEHGKYDIVILSQEMAEKNGFNEEKCKSDAVAIYAENVDNAVETVSDEQTESNDRTVSDEQTESNDRTISDEETESNDQTVSDDQIKSDKQTGSDRRDQ